MVNLAGIADNATVLQRCFLFESLSQEERELLGRRAFRQDFHVDEKLFGFGDPGESMMIVLQGSIRIRRPMGGEDREMILNDLEPGDILGEMAVLDGKPRSAEARGITNGKVLILARRELMPFLEGHPKVALALLAALCDRIRNAEERTSDILSSLSYRLAKTLARLAQKSAKFSHSQTELAEMIGATRESVNRQLNAWHAEGLIEMKDRWITVPDPQRLLARS
jgi:CRP-like cAMP-binding protein